MGNQPHHQLL